MEEEDSTQTEVLEAISIYLITLLFTKTLPDIIRNMSNSFSILSSLDKELQAYLFLAINTIEIIRYHILWEIFPKSTAVLDICLNINKYKRAREFWRYAHVSCHLFSYWFKN